MLHQAISYNMLPSSTLPTTQIPTRRYRRRTVAQDRRPHRTEITGEGSNESAEKKHSKEGQSSGKRNRPSALVVTRVEPLLIPLPLDKIWIVQTATSVLVDHLLFTRGLFPITVAELLAHQSHVESNDGGTFQAAARDTFNSIHSSPSTRRKLRQARNQLQQFTQVWNSNGSSDFLRRASHVLITLGPSFGRGRESYLVDLRGLSHQSASSQQRQTLRPLPPPPGVLARRLLPRVMESESGADLPSSAASLRLFVSLYLPKEELEGYWKAVSDVCAKDSSISDIHTTSSNTRWIPRTGRVLPKSEELYSFSRAKRPKKRLVAISLKHQSTETDVVLESDADILGLGDSAEKDGQWFTLTQVIKGFRL